MNLFKNLKFRLTLLVLICVTAQASDEILIDGVAAFYKGGQETLCKDYEVLIKLEHERIKEKNGGKKNGVASNDDISSIFRVMGLEERVGGEKLAKAMEKCRN